ncbi:uncharacterized protein LOC135116359 [Scylla paramamosain]|uniref:uncharacterized protein LOC135116359 n=1 Tax=Scylla paramamosain TaxID=85552 RepID=UPI003083EABF
MMDMREVLGASKWFLAADLQTVTLSSDQQCVTFVVHFMGPSAGRLELDLSRVLAGRNLDHPTITIRGVYPDPDRPKKLPYRTCGSLEEETLLEDQPPVGSQGRCCRSWPRPRPAAVSASPHRLR